MSAKKARPDSSTWLNLLMAFAAVAGIVMPLGWNRSGRLSLLRNAGLRRDSQYCEQCKGDDKDCWVQE